MALLSLIAGRCGAQRKLDRVPVEAAAGEEEGRTAPGGGVAGGRQAAAPGQRGPGPRRLGRGVRGRDGMERPLDGGGVEAARRQGQCDPAAAVEAPLGQRPGGVGGQRRVVEEAEAGGPVERGLDRRR